MPDSGTASEDYARSPTRPKINSGHHRTEDRRRHPSSLRAHADASESSGYHPMSPSTRNGHCIHSGENVHLSNHVLTDQGWCLAVSCR